MDLHKRKRIEIIVEKPALGRITKLIEGVDEITGYTVLPVVGGQGHSGMRSPQTVSGVFDNVLVLIITTEPAAQRLIEQFHLLTDELIAIVAVSDCEVIRASHF